MKNTQLEQVIPGITNHMELLDELLPPESEYSNGKESLSLYVTGIFGFRHEDLCATHTAAYIQLTKEYDKFDTSLDHFNKLAKSAQESLGDTPSPDDLNNLQTSYFVRLQGYRTHELYLNSIRSFADQHFVVGLWVVVEQSIAKLFKLFQEKTGQEFRIPYRWNETITLFDTLNILTDQELPIYKNINELRTLNNKIKHLNTVDDALAEFSYFSELKGKSIDRIPLELQRYSDNAYAFVNFIAEQLIIE